MALIKCRECAGEISSSVVSCPRCGASASRQWSRGETALIILGAVLLLGFVATMFPSGGSDGGNPGPAASVETESVRSSAAANYESTAMLPVPDEVAQAAREQVANSGYACRGAGAVREVGVAAQSGIKILKVDCGAAAYQLTVFNNKGFVKPWTGTLLGE